MAALEARESAIGHVRFLHVSASIQLKGACLPAPFSPLFCALRCHRQRYHLKVPIIDLYSLV